MSSLLPSCQWILLVAIDTLLEAGSTRARFYPLVYFFPL